MTQKKQPYVPPELDVYRYVVEKGFQQSVKASEIPETFSEYNELGGSGGSATDNGTGTWDVEW